MEGLLVEKTSTLIRIGCLFGDNLERKGKKGQAVIRGAKNAVGLVTKRAPRMCDSAFLTDSDYREVMQVIRSDLSRIERKMSSSLREELGTSTRSRRSSRVSHYTHLVIPQECWGTGLAQLDVRAPRIFAKVKKIHEDLLRKA